MTISSVGESEISAIYTVRHHFYYNHSLLRNVSFKKSLMSENIETLHTLCLYVTIAMLFWLKTVVFFFFFFFFSF